MSCSLVRFSWSTSALCLFSSAARLSVPVNHVEDRCPVLEVDVAGVTEKVDARGEEDGQAGAAEGLWAGETRVLYGFMCHVYGGETCNAAGPIRLLSS